MQLGLLLDGVGRESRQQRTATGQDAQRRTQRGAAQHGGQHALEVFLGREQARDLGGEHFALVVRTREVGNDFAVAEHAHGDGHEADAVGEFRHVEAEARDTRVHVGTDQAQQQAQHDHRDRLEQRTRCQHHGTDQAQDHQREVFGWAELEGQLGQRRCEGGKNERADATCEERAQAGRGERRTCTALARHLVAVDHGHHRRRFAGQVHQNGGGRAAVLRAVVDAGQHDQRRHGRQRVGGGQQHRDGRDRADARQHADQRAQNTADEAVQQIREGEGNAKTQREVFKQFHGVSSFLRLNR
ncbi:hypothetical protein D3C71_1371340 [compost metagenome]